MSEVLSPSQGEGEVAQETGAPVELGDARVVATLLRTKQLERAKKQPRNLLDFELPSPRLLTALPTPLHRVFAQSEGVNNRTYPKSMVAESANLLIDLMICASTGSLGTLHRTLLEQFPGSQGERMVAQMKTMGYRVAFETGSKSISPEQVENIVLDTVEPWSIVVTEKGKVKDKGFTNPWWELAVSAGIIDPPLLNEKGRPVKLPQYRPTTYEQVKELYLQLSARKSETARDDVFYVVLDAQTEIDGGQTRTLALASGRAMEDRGEKDRLIHSCRRGVFPNYQRVLRFLPKSLGAKPLSYSDRAKVIEAVEAVTNASTGLSNSDTFTTLIGALLRVDAFRRLRPEVQNYVINEWILALWLPTGDFGKPNPANLGLNARILPSGVATIGS